MTSNEILKADVLDILFDNRNKQYGAYTLRKNYNKRLGLSLGLSLSLVLLLFLLARIDNRNANIIEEGPVVRISSLYIPPEPVPETPKPPKNPATTKPAATQQFNNIDIVEDHHVNKALAEQSELLTSNISNHFSEGPDLLPGENQPNGVTGETNQPEVKHDPPADPPIQSEPEFPGGMQAWQKFLNKYLNVPGDLEAGEKKSVIISFKVAEDGFVTGFQIIKSAGEVYDNEVLRVLKKMPRWKPAIQNNKPVARSFTQPVTFMGLTD